MRENYDITENLNEDTLLSNKSLQSQRCVIQAWPNFQGYSQTFQMSNNEGN